MRGNTLLICVEWRKKKMVKVPAPEWGEMLKVPSNFQIFLFSGVLTTRQRADLTGGSER